MRLMADTITEYRALHEAISLAEATLGITCTYFSDPRLVKLQKGDKTHFIFGYLFDINYEAAAELANDKAAMYEVLTGSKLAVVPHYLLSNVLKPRVSLADLSGLFAKHESLVIKPNGGNKGEMIARFDSPEQAFEYTQANPKISWCASPYINIAREIRVVVLNGVAKLACEKINPEKINNLKMYNLTLGATAKGLDLSEIEGKVIELAEKSVKALGLNMGAADIIIDDNGNAYVLEINDGFSLERFALSSDKAHKEVVAFYGQAIAALFSE